MTTRQLTIDIRTRFIDDEQNAYIVFPGSGYRLYSLFRQSKSVFLDIPGFPMFDGEAFGTMTDIPERTIVSDRIKAWHLTGRTDQDVPAKAVADLTPYRITPARQQFAGQVRNFFTVLKVGDLIVVPCDDYEGEIMFGEVLSLHPLFVDSDMYEGE